MVGREPLTETTESGDHLVEDQERRVLIAKAPQRLEVSVFGRKHPGRTLHRLCDDGGNLAAAIGHQSGQCLDVIAWHLHYFGQ